MGMRHADGPNRFDESMGAELGEVMHVLDNKLVELHVVWLQYRQLFGTDEVTIDLINRNGGLFFKIVQDELWDSVLLGIARMTDKAMTGKNRNLTLNSLPSLIADKVFRATVEDLIAEALKEADFAVEHRHKRIAHRDHDVAVSQSALPLSGISRTKVESMLESLRAVLNALHHHYRDATFLYDRVIDRSGANALLSRLRKLDRLERGN